jgi:cell division cycle 2-like
LEWISYNLLSIALNDYNISIALHQVYNGLEFIYANYSIHRDLKPGNILIQRNDDELTVKITDFREMRYYVSGNIETYIGTSWYMALELMERKPAYTNTADI